jgi:NNP family nitrate/nitrite transporter-like MFS transporter
VGFSAAFPLLLKSQFPTLTFNLAFLGALIGSLTRPFGGWLADRVGGARVTFFNFLVMAGASLLLLRALSQHQLSQFLLAFLVLFASTGIGNGSTFRMIPAIFRGLQLQRIEAGNEAAQEQALLAARRETAAVIGLVAALGALGGFFIPQAFAASIKATGSPELAVHYFFGFYVCCIAITYVCYLRRSFLTRTAPVPASARV